MATLPCSSLADPVLHSSDEVRLDAIVQQDRSLTIWERQLSPQFAAQLAKLALEDCDDLEITVGLPVAPLALASNLAVSGYPETTAQMLAADIAPLANRFAAVTGSTRLKVKLEVIETDACRKFHADYVTYRLLTTYRGQGTQWLRTAHPDGIEQLGAGAVAIFKGRLLAQDPPILHRSPPIGVAGEQRLLLVIDPADTE